MFEQEFKSEQPQKDISPVPEDILETALAADSEVVSCASSDYKPKSAPKKRAAKAARKEIISDSMSDCEAPKKRGRKKQKDEEKKDKKKDQAAQKENPKGEKK